MRNRIVGFIILGVAVLIGFIIFSFNTALTDIVNTACTHGPSCPMWGTIEFQTNVSLGIMLFVVAIALYLIFFGEEEKIITKVKTKEDYQKIINKLTEDEKLVLEKIIEAEGTLFQSDLADKMKFSKVKVTRILDRLEGKGLIERRRRGMTNVVILRH